MRSFCLFFALVSIFASQAWQAAAQKTDQELIDSVLKKLPGYTNDSDRLKGILSLSNNYMEVNPDEGVKYAQQGLAIAQNMHWPKRCAEMESCIGVNLYFKADYPQALEHLLKSLKVAEEIDDKDVMINALVNIGNIYAVQFNSTLALQYFLKALKIAELEGEKADKSDMVKIYDNIGDIYNDQQDHEKALEYQTKALRMSEDIGDRDGQASALINIGTIYVSANNEDSGLQYYLKSLTIEESLGSKVAIAHVYGLIGSAFSDFKDYPNGIAYSTAALKMDKEIDNKLLEAYVLNDIGRAYYGIATDTIKKQGKWENLPMPAGLPVTHGSQIPTNRNQCLHLAISYFTQALALAKETNNPDVMWSSYESLSKANKTIGDFRQALEDYRNYAAIRDSVFSKTNERKIASMTAQYDLDKKQDEISLLEKDNQLNATKIRQRTFQRNATIFGSLLLLGLLGATSLAWIQRRTKKMQIAFTRSLMQNQETERQRISRELHDSIGQNILFIKNQLSGQGNNDTMAPVMETIGNTIEEVRNISKELYPNQLEKYGLAAAVDALGEKTHEATGIFISSDLQEIETVLWKEASINLYRIIQESLNNIIKHANAKAVRITGTKASNKIVLAIMDNGKGFDPAILERKAQRSFGMLNMEERAKMLNGAMELESAAGGTKITITIPIINEV